MCLKKESASARSGPLLVRHRQEGAGEQVSVFHHGNLPRGRGLSIHRPPDAEDRSITASFSKDALPISLGRLSRQDEESFNRLHDRLIREGIEDLDLKITNNGSVMLTASRDRVNRRYKVRMQKIFLGAPPRIVDALASYIVRDDRAASRTIDEFIRKSERLLPRRRKRSAAEIEESIRAKGEHYDLDDILHCVNQRHFASEPLEVSITWGRRRSTARSQKTIQLGSYCFEERLIRINPVLDQRWIPQGYLEWVVYHELLHARIPVERKGPMRRFHTRSFRAAEKAFKGHRAAQSWERKHAERLLRS